MAKSIFFISLFLHLSLYSVEFVLFTQPKTGTHLLIPILQELTGKNVYWAQEYKKKSLSIHEPFEEAIHNSDFIFFSFSSTPWLRSTMDRVWEKNRSKHTFLHLHPPFSPTMEKYLIEKKCVSFFVKRDPRDQIVSLLNHYKNIHFNEKEIKLLESDDERLLYMIERSRLQTMHYMGWLTSPICCVLDFNKLMGSHGGAATDADALEEMRKIANALQLNLSDNYLQKIYKKHFGKGWNFFRGKASSWKNYFNEEHKEMAKQELGDLLIELGFESDLNW